MFNYVEYGSFFSKYSWKKRIHSKPLWIGLENINRTYSIKFWIINDNTHIVLLYSFVKQNVFKLVILTSVSALLFTWGLFWHFKALYLLMHRFCSCCSCCATAVFLDILKSKKPKSDTEASRNKRNKNQTLRLISFKFSENIHQPILHGINTKSNGFHGNSLTKIDLFFFGIDV